MKNCILYYSKCANNDCFIYRKYSKRNRDQNKGNELTATDVVIPNVNEAAGNGNCFTCITTNVFGRRNMQTDYKINYTPRFNEVERRYTGFTSSVRPSVHPPSVRLWTESCQLCNSHNTSWLHFMFTHRIKQLQKVCCVYFCFSTFQNMKFWRLFF